MNLRLSLLATSALLAAAIGTPVYAQTVIEALVVTAQEKEEALQDVPVAVLEKAEIDSAANPFGDLVTDFYLTDDSSGLFRNTFYTEPRTYGVWLAKHF